MATDVDGAAVPEPDVDASIAAMFDPSAKKKKKKTKAKADADEATAGAAPSDSVDAGLAAPAVAAAAAPASASETAPNSHSLGSTVDGDDEISYEDMLSRVYKLLYANNPELTDRTRKKLKPPEVMRVGTTRTCWVNFKEICMMMKRTTDHVLSFFLNELGTTGSIDGADRMLMRGKYQPKYIESLLRKYISEYVTCHMCKSVETELSRDPISRLYFLQCKACGSQRSVAPIKAGFHATARGDRKKARELTG